jgi:hypothetical protein
MPNGPGFLTPGPSTYTVAAVSEASPGPSFSSVTRTTCSGRCAVPMNKSVDSTPAIRMVSSWHAPVTKPDPPRSPGRGARPRPRYLTISTSRTQAL